MPTANAVQRGQVAIYSQGVVQSGAGLADWMKKARQAHDFVKKNKLISKGASLASALGADAYLDSKTGGKYKQATALAKSKGYGKRKAPARRRK